MRTMVRAVEDAMEAGALGISTGLEYESGRYAGLAELETLARAVGARGGIYASHIRNRDEHLQAAVDEFMTVAHAAGDRGQISHLNVRHNTGAAPGAWERAVETLERHRAAGMDVLADATPMVTGDGVMAGILPAWLTAEGPAKAALLLRDPGIRRQLRGDCDRYWRFIARGEWDRVRLLSSAEHPDLCGLTFPEIARSLGVDEWDAYFDILADAGENLAGPSLIGVLFTEEMSRAHVAHPLFLLGVDTMSSRIDGPLATQTRHPLHFAGHVHYLVHHVREAGTLTLEEAVRKMTSMVAARFGLRDRGELRHGAFADIAIFDPEGLEERSTIAQPLAYARGFEHVLVNGTAVLSAGEHTGSRPGRFLPAGA
jgi:N-acyl-D-amino-acid deacylase